MAGQTLPDKKRARLGTPRGLAATKAIEMAKRSHVVRLLKNLPEAPWPSDDPMSGAQCARLLGVSRAAVTQACVQGRLRHAKDGRALLIARADLQAYMADIVRRADALGLHVPAAVRRALGQSAQA